MEEGGCYVIADADDVAIDFTRKAKYLGFILDRKSDVADKVRKANTALYTVRRDTGLSWGM